MHSELSGSWISCRGL